MGNGKSFKQMEDDKYNEQNNGKKHERGNKCQDDDNNDEYR